MVVTLFSPRNSKLPIHSFFPVNLHTDTYDSLDPRLTFLGLRPPTAAVLVCSSTGMNHDYGRADGRCLLDQRDFLAGEPPDQRVLEETVTGEGAACWQLKTW